MRRLARRCTVAGGIALGIAAGVYPATAQLGCCEFVSPIGGRVCANTLAFECTPPSTFFFNLTCDGDTGQCFEDNNPLRALDRKSTDPGFALFDGDVVLRVPQGTTVYRRIGACNDTGQTLNYHTVFTNEGPEPEFLNAPFALANGACTATQTLQATAETTVLKVSKWCASVEPITVEQCPPPHAPQDAASGSAAVGQQGVFGNSAISVLAVPGERAPALGLPALGGLALLLFGLGLLRTRRR